MTASRRKQALALQSFGVWLIFLLVAVLNGGIRQHYLEKHFTPLAAHQLSTLLLGIAIFIIGTVFIRGKHLTNIRTLLAIGLAWASLTLVFEFSFFHYASGKPWGDLLADYNLFEGRLFSLVIITLLATPVIARKRSAGPNSA